MKPLTAVAERVANCAQLALLLEVSAYPKPGNVHRTADYPLTTYEHFLASIVAMRPSFEKAAERGAKCASGHLSMEETRIGFLIKDAAERMLSSQSGGNTHLGTIILVIPMAVAAALCIARERLSIEDLRGSISSIIRSATPRDTVDLYDAIRAVRPAGLGRVERLDVMDPRSREAILRDYVTPYDVFRIASPYDVVAREWVTGYSVTFELGYPYFREASKGARLNDAIVNTFLKILSEVPDTFIARQFGDRRAEEVSALARGALEAGGMTTDSGRRAVWALDDRLRKGDLNPGTTADLVSSVLMVAALFGLKP